MTKRKSIFTGWMADGRKFIDPGKVADGRTFKAHEGAEVKRLIEAKRLKPQFNRAGS